MSENPLGDQGGTLVGSGEVAGVCSGKDGQPKLLSGCEAMLPCQCQLGFAAKSGKFECKFGFRVFGATDAQLRAVTSTIRAALASEQGMSHGMIA